MAISKLGKEIGKRLLDLEKNQEWLIAQVRERTGLYFDSSYMHKIKTGKIATPKIVNAICEILGLENEQAAS